MLKFFSKRKPRPYATREALERALALEAQQMAARVALGNRALVPALGKPSNFRYHR